MSNKNSTPEEAPMTQADELKINAARIYADAMRRTGQALGADIIEDALKALEAENKRMEARYLRAAASADIVRDSLQKRSAQYDEVRAERDEFKRLFSECHPVHLDGVREARALQAQLDSMTTETRYKPDWVVLWGTKAPREQRLVGPWTEAL